MTSACHLFHDICDGAYVCMYMYCIALRRQLLAPALTFEPLEKHVIVMLRVSDVSDTLAKLQSKSKPCDGSNIRTI